MFKNSNVTPAKANGTPIMGGGKADANMPANNIGTFPVKLGAGQNSKMSAGGQNAAQGGSNQSKTGGKANMPANNITNNGPALGTTKHGVGKVPGYLRSK